MTHYKLKRWLVNDLVSFITAATVELQDEKDTDRAIQTLAFDHIVDGEHVLLPVESVKEILEVPISGLTTGLVGRRQTLINRVWDCDLVKYEPMQGYWKIPHPNIEGFVYMNPVEYSQAKDYYDVGKKIHAIKVIREDTRLSLKDAKELYEQTFMLAKRVDNKGD